MIELEETFAFLRRNNIKEVRLEGLASEIRIVQNNKYVKTKINNKWEKFPILNFDSYRDYFTRTFEIVGNIIGKVEKEDIYFPVITTINGEICYIRDVLIRDVAFKIKNFKIKKFIKKRFSSLLPYLDKLGVYFLYLGNSYAILDCEIEGKKDLSKEEKSNLEELIGEIKRVHIKAIEVWKNYSSITAQKKKEKIENLVKNLFEIYEEIPKEKALTEISYSISQPVKEEKAEEKLEEKVLISEKEEKFKEICIEEIKNMEYEKIKSFLENYSPSDFFEKVAFIKYENKKKEVKEEKSKILDYAFFWFHTNKKMIEEKIENFTERSTIIRDLLLPKFYQYLEIQETS
jgi:hypothetical protein